MRGADRQSAKLFSYLSPEALVPPDHPLRHIRLLVNAALDRLSAEFDAIYAEAGRPSVPPERLLRRYDCKRSSRSARSGSSWSSWPTT